jgi:hypothetical protein
MRPYKTAPRALALGLGAQPCFSLYYRAITPVGLGWVRFGNTHPSRRLSSCASSFVADLGQPVPVDCGMVSADPHNG